MRHAGATVTFGSDWPVAPLDPITGIAAAVLRRTTDGKQVFGPEERVTPLQALTAYTRNNAYAGFQEHTHGRIAPGFVADLKDHAVEHGFHVHDERHFVESYSLRQNWEVDLHPEEGCEGPVDL